MEEFRMTPKFRIQMMEGWHELIQPPHLAEFEAQKAI
jgi:hypothetical protein